MINIYWQTLTVLSKINDKMCLDGNTFIVQDLYVGSVYIYPTELYLLLMISGTFVIVKTLTQAIEDTVSLDEKNTSPFCDGGFSNSIRSRIKIIFICYKVNMHVFY